MNALADYREAVITSSLRKCQIFAGLPTEDLAKIARFTVMKTLEKGDYLFHEGETSKGFYIVQKGAVNIHRVSALGKEQVIHVFRTGESFAEGALAMESGYPADARAVEVSQVLLVQKSGFVDLLKRHPELALRMLASMSLHLRILVSQIEDLTLKNVETRLANWLLKRSPGTDEKAFEIQLSIPKRVLAAEIGTVSETLSRTLARFRDQKLLEVKGRTLIVLSRNRLSSLLEQNLEGREIASVE